MNTQYLYCINCGKNRHVYVSDEKFHVIFKVKDLKFVGKYSATYSAEPVRCFGPFAYDEPKEIINYAETDIEQLASLKTDERYTPSVQEILIDNIRYSYFQ